jgi:hypothetical protein
MAGLRLEEVASGVESQSMPLGCTSLRDDDHQRLVGLGGALDQDLHFDEIAAIFLLQIFQRFVPDERVGSRR